LDTKLPKSVVNTFTDRNIKEALYVRHFMSQMRITAQKLSVVKVSNPSIRHNYTMAVRPNPQMYTFHMPAVTVRPL